ncbi:MAG: SRPBCC domain-containing protein [Defluviitaleaceae bacterium]|nr:SRPBCC domain-containing protein [Defluviitaleaceae bacterium]
MATIRLEVTYPAPKEAVWEHLVNYDLLSKWCMPSKGFVLEKRQRFDFNIKPSIFFCGTFNNTVLDFNEADFLTYQCTAIKPKLKTIVKWTLTEVDGKTKLSLEHGGFEGYQFIAKSMIASGRKKMMKEHLAQQLSRNT